MRVMVTEIPETFGEYNPWNCSCWHDTGGHGGGMETHGQAPGVGSVQMVGPPEEFSEILEQQQWDYLMAPGWTLGSLHLP